MLVTALLYVAAIVAVIVVAPLMSIPLALAFTPLVRGHRRLAPAILGVQYAIAVGLAMALFVWFCGAMGREASPWMFVIPFLGMTSNDINRIRRAGSGATPVPAWMERQGEFFDASAVTGQEVGMYVGGVLGMGVVFVLTFA